MQQRRLDGIMVILLCILRPRIGTDTNEYDTGWVVGVFDDSHVFGAKEQPPGFTKVDVNLNKNQVENFVELPYFQDVVEPDGVTAPLQFQKREWRIERSELTNPQQTAFDNGFVTISVNRMGRALINNETDLDVFDSGLWPPP